MESGNGQHPAEAFHEMDRRDGALMEAEFEGRTSLVDDFAYSFHSGGKLVTGISYTGTKELAMRLASANLQETPYADWHMVIKVDCEDPELRELVLDDQTRLYLAKKKLNCTGKRGWELWKEMPERDREEAKASFDEMRKYYCCKAMGEDALTGRTSVGFAEQDAFESFAWRKAGSKAMRNAIRALLPEASIKAFVRDVLLKREGKRPEYETEQERKVREWADQVVKVAKTIPALTGDADLRKTALENVLRKEAGDDNLKWTIKDLALLSTRTRDAILKTVTKEAEEGVIDAEVVETEG